MLQITESTVRYAIARLADGASPAESRETALFVSGELEVMASALRRLTRLRPAERRVLAAQLTSLGMSRREVADRLGVSDRSVRKYLAGTRPQPVNLSGAGGGARPVAD